MNRHTTTRLRSLAAFLALALAVLGCSATATNSTPGTGSTPGTTPTSTTAHAPTPTTPPTAPPHAFAWYQVDGAHVPQIWASINGAVPKQITHVAPDGSECDDQIAWGLPVFSPDLTHIASALGSYNCGDGALAGPLSIITVSSGAITPVPGSPSVTLLNRTAGWLNNSTVWFITFNGLSTYALGGGVTNFSGLTHPDEAVLRGSVLFWSTHTGAPTGPWTNTLYRYSMSTHSALPGSINLGQIASYHGSLGGYATPGWDASADGAHITYQQVSPGAPGSGGVVAPTHFYYANADGSGATHIASYVSTNSTALLLFSPNGHLIAISGANPTPNVITASVSSPGNNGDPNLHFYHPDAGQFPAWKWDSTEFWATNSSGSTPSIYRYTVSSSSSTLAQSGGQNPWYTIGS